MYMFTVSTPPLLVTDGVGLDVGTGARDEERDVSVRPRGPPSSPSPPRGLESRDADSLVDALFLLV